MQRAKEEPHDSSRVPLSEAMRASTSEATESLRRENDTLKQAILEQNQQFEHLQRDFQELKQAQTVQRALPAPSPYTVAVPSSAPGISQSSQAVPPDWRSVVDAAIADVERCEHVLQQAQRNSHSALQSFNQEQSNLSAIRGNLMNLLRKH